jgi:CPA2 family monovalent cation:H+ antiporter-2
MEFSPKALLEVKWVALLGAPLGILMSIGLGMLVGMLLGWPPLSGVIVGMVVSVASTMVLARLLADRGELQSPHGRVMIGLTLVEDLAVVVLTILIPVFGELGRDRLLALGIAFGKAALILVPFAFLAAKVVPQVMSLVARMRNDEMLLLVALAIGLGTAAPRQPLVLAHALGAFLAGPRVELRARACRHAPAPPLRDVSWPSSSSPSAPSSIRAR